MSAVMSPALTRRPLRVAVCLAAPWAYVEDLCVEGDDVRAVRKYADWRGRELYWLNVAESDLPGALARGEVDLAIGGLTESPALRASARLARCPDSHAWAVAGDSWFEWAWVSYYLRRQS